MTTTFRRNIRSSERKLLEERIAAFEKEWKQRCDAYLEEARLKFLVYNSDASQLEVALTAVRNKLLVAKPAELKKCLANRDVPEKT